MSTEVVKTTVGNPAAGFLTAVTHFPPRKAAAMAVG